MDTVLCGAAGNVSTRWIVNISDFIIHGKCLQLLSVDPRITWPVRA